MNLITSEDIKKFGSYGDRKDSFDDEIELDVISNFLRTRCNKTDKIKKKPYGIYGVDIGVFDFENNLKFVVDVERWSSWKEDWPSNYRYLSFLERKEKFLKYSNFVMIFFNYNLTKFVRIKKEDIISISPEKRYTKGKYDMVRKIPFECGKMYGTNFGELEKSIFEYEICDFLYETPKIIEKNGRV